MKKSRLFISFFIAGLFFVSLLTFTACGDDEIKGCTNPVAENYAADATSDDGSCVFAREKFLGTYTGTFLCNTLPAMNNDVSITIDQGFDIQQVTITINDPLFQAFPLTGTASGNSIDVDVEIGPLPIFDVDGDMVSDNVLLSISGTIITSDGGNSISGTLNVTIALPDGTPVITDACNVMGTKT